MEILPIDGGIKTLYHDRFMLGLLTGWGGCLKDVAFVVTAPARLNFHGEKSYFKISDNPLIECLDSRSANIKLMFDFMRTEEYRR